MTVFNENRTYGVELEVVTGRQARTLATAINNEFRARGIEATCTQQSYNHQVSSSWKIVSDSTIRPRGWEVVSPILKGHEGREQIKAVCKALNDLDCETNTTVGMHVHHDARGLTAKQIGGVFGTYSAFQTLLNYGVSRSRRGIQWGGYNSIADWSRVTRDNDNYNTIGDGINADTEFTGPRGMNMQNFITAIYRKVGMNRACSVSIGSSLSRHGTIEFRQHQGTINATKIWAWLLITQSIVERQTQNRVSFPKPVYMEVASGKTIAKGDFYRFKSFIAVSADRNNHDSEAAAPYSWAFKVLYKSIKKFAAEDGIADPKEIGKNNRDFNYIRP